MGTMAIGALHATIDMPALKKLPKDPLFITDMDLENLYDQWEDADDEKLEEDELPPHKRPPAAGFKMSDDIMKDPEQLMKLSKKGKTVMTFVSIGNNPTKDETEAITQRWQVGLLNNHLKCERYVVADDRALFVFSDGTLAYDAKDFLLEQPELKEFMIDNRTWQGKAYPVEKVTPDSAKHDSNEAAQESQTSKLTRKNVKDEL